MRNIFIGLLVLCAFCIVPGMAALENQPDGSLYAKEAVLQFTNLQENDVKYIGMMKTNHGNYHQFSTPDNSVYYVNGKSGNIDRVDMQFDWKQTRDVKISKETAKKIAKDVIGKFSGIKERSGMKIVSSQLLDHGAFQEYSVEFREVVDGVILPNTALVSINPSNGELLSYVSVNEPVTIPLIPKISPEEVVKIAAQEYPGIRVVSSETNLVIGFPEPDNQKLIYQITLVGEPVDDMMYGGFLAIDAMDGKIWYNSAFM